MRRLAVLRPEPGNAATCARIRSIGLEPIALPLFEVKPIDWTAPVASAFDALILTSANTLRHAGAELARYAELPAYAVGAATAHAASAAGLRVTMTGHDNAGALIAAAAQSGVRRALHLGGRETGVTAGGVVAASIAVYASDAIDIAVDRLVALAGATALLHSVRAAERFGALCAGCGIDRASIALAAISPAVALAAGNGWTRLAVAATPDDHALITAAAAAD